MNFVRITITLDTKVQAKLRDKQAAAIKSKQKSVSFSAVLNEVLAEALKVKLD